MGDLDPKSPRSDLVWQGPYLGRELRVISVPTDDGEDGTPLTTFHLQDVTDGRVNPGPVQIEGVTSEELWSFLMAQIHQAGMVAGRRGLTDRARDLLKRSPAALSPSAQFELGLTTLPVVTIVKNLDAGLIGEIPGGNAIAEAVTVVQDGDRWDVALSLADQTFVVTRDGCESESNARGVASKLLRGLVQLVKTFAGSI